MVQLRGQIKINIDKFSRIWDLSIDEEWISEQLIPQGIYYKCRLRSFVITDGYYD